MGKKEKLKTWFVRYEKPLCAGLFFVVWSLLRLPWLTCDGGIPSVWEYGYFVTDEGYYLGGGKEKYLWNAFVDLARIEAFTYGFSPGTHILSYLAHLCFGLSIWAWRIPFVLINATAWLVLFNFLSKKVRPFYALLLCAAVSCTPMIVAYERTASNDVLIGSLLVLSYIAASLKGVKGLFLSAVLAASIVLVKPSVYVLLPIVLASVLSVGHCKNKLVDLVVFISFSAAFIGGFKLLAALLVQGDAVSQQTTMWEIVKRTTTHYPLPDLTNVPMILKGWSNFPRDPSGVLLGVWTIVLTVAPILAFCRRAVSLKATPNLILYAIIPAYMAGISIMNTLYTHYFIPVMMMIPILWASLNDDLRSDAPIGKNHGSCRALLVPVAAVGIGFAVWIWAENLRIDPGLLQKYYARIYNFSSENVWKLTLPYVLVLTGGVTAFGWLFARRLNLPKVVLILVLPFVSFVCASVCLAKLPAVLFAPFMRADQMKYLVNMTICVSCGVAFILGVLTATRHMTRAGIWYAIPACCLILSVMFSPFWRDGAFELLRPGTHYHDQAARTLKKLLPADAVVIGERANQMLMSLPIRTATTFPTNSDPIPIIKNLVKRNPKTPLFALIDSQHAYCIQHYEKNKNWCRLVPLHKFRMPSFGTGKLADVHLCAIQILDP